jgi:hypothetical protein
MGQAHSGTVEASHGALQGDAGSGSGSGAAGHEVNSGKEEQQHRHPHAHFLESFSQDELNQVSVS